MGGVVEMKGWGWGSPMKPERDAGDVPEDAGDVEGGDEEDQGERHGSWLPHHGLRIMAAVIAVVVNSHSRRLCVQQLCCLKHDDLFYWHLCA